MNAKAGFETVILDMDDPRIPAPQPESRLLIEDRCYGNRAKQRLADQLATHTAEIV
jgi:hypothetical protein